MTRPQKSPVFKEELESIAKDFKAMKNDFKNVFKELETEIRSFSKEFNSGFQIFEPKTNKVKSYELSESEKIIRFWESDESKKIENLHWSLNRYLKKVKSKYYTSDELFEILLKLESLNNRLDEVNIEYPLFY